MFLSRFSNKRYTIAFLSLIGFVLAVNYIDPSSFVSSATWKLQQKLYTADARQRSGETTVVTHAPGFTLFENAYWKNNTWYFVSSRSWAFPEMSLVMTNAPGYDEWPPVFHDGLARLMTVSEADVLGLTLKDAEVVKGSTFVFNDKTFYHLVGEMFLGAWRVYTSVLVDQFDTNSQKAMYANTKSVIDQLPSVDRFIFNHARPDKVFDHGKLNQYFFDKVLYVSNLAIHSRESIWMSELMPIVGVFARPRSTLEFANDWQARADSLKLFRFDMVLIADRWSGHMNGSPKPMARAFQLPVPSNWVSDLKQRMLADYRCSVSLKDPSHAHSKPVITYLSRQEAVFRTLSDEAHEALSVGLKSLEKEGLAEVNIETFTDALSKDEQVAKLSRTTIFVTLHGNGLTNLIWMTPDAYDRSAIYEIQQPGMYTDDYAIISEALGIDHWIIGGRDPEREANLHGTSMYSSKTTARHDAMLAMRKQSELTLKHDLDGLVKYQQSANSADPGDQTIIPFAQTEINMSKTANVKRIAMICMAVCSVLAISYVLPSYAGFRPVGTRSRHSLDSETSILSHAPGFTVLENAYWREDKWYFVTSRKWAFPNMKLVVTDGAVSWDDVKWDDGVVQMVSLQEARELNIGIEEAESVEGTSCIATVMETYELRPTPNADTIILFMTTVLDHFYHLIEEMFLGAWRTYTSILTDSLDDTSSERPFSSTKSVFDRLPPINRFSFIRVRYENVYDHANLNDFFLSKVFPAAEREYVDSWRARASSKKLYRFERAIIADRKSGHLGGGYKPMDKAFELPVPSTWVSDIKARILRNYQGPVTLQDSSHRKSKPVITYLSRQTATFRRLKQESHEELVAGLKSLEQEGIAEVHIEEFTDNDLKDDQVAKLSRTTILVGLHGNGMTNLIYMTPDAHHRSTVFEIQKTGMTIDDYAILSEALGIDHWIIGGRNDTTKYPDRAILVQMVLES
ncbi:hypothetical protein QFC21_002584 [Naganishia friedmannii]|uniref:Uncharacterized protein n=1 Tax=Naganishia friedmannii TaxID=89922 RepID=A0ACC2VUY9_9TREE|nr:hypothetical protein QFC21_002584 [Naganishia friedmannii]